jgi:hypothetical protein
MALRSEKILIKKNNKDFKHYKSACRITTAIYNCAITILDKVFLIVIT